VQYAFTLIVFASFRAPLRGAFLRPLRKVLTSQGRAKSSTCRTLRRGEGTGNTRGEVALSSFIDWVQRCLRGCNGGETVGGVSVRPKTRKRKGTTESVPTIELVKGFVAKKKQRTKIDVGKN